MKKILLIYRIHKDDPGNVGVIKKCNSQAMAFSQLGLSVDTIVIGKEGILKTDTLVFKKHLSPHSISLYLFYFFQFGRILEAIFKKEQYDVIYLRHPFFDPLLVRFLKKAKKNNPNLKICLEINTYPYDAEPKRFLHKLSLKMDQHYRKSAYQYIDRIVDYGKNDRIWNIPTINIQNGIDVNQIPLNENFEEEDTLRLIAIGNWEYWHGLDRLILGLVDYYSRERNLKVTLKIVGAGKELSKYKILLEKYGLQNIIAFCSPILGKQLDIYFRESDIGVGTLAMYRKGVLLDSSLKHREYCARGIPFIFAGEDSDFPDYLPFINKVPANDSPINIEVIIMHFNKLKKQNPDYQNEMRNYAKERLSWEHKLKAVVDYAKE